jgi:hypothetical protein
VGTWLGVRRVAAARPAGAEPVQRQGASLRRDVREIFDLSAERPPALEHLKEAPMEQPVRPLPGAALRAHRASRAQRSERLAVPVLQSLKLLVPQQ